MEQQPEFLWQEWRGNETPESSLRLLDAFRPMIRQEVGRQSGTLPTSFLDVEAKRLAFDAFDSFDPKRGTRLSTHVGNRLKGLARVNYTYQNALRMPEDRQRKFNVFMTAKRKLEESLGREPSIAELSRELVWSDKEVGMMEKAVHRETPEHSDVAVGTPAHYISGAGRDTAVVDYIYHDLGPEEKIIFEAVTGYSNHPILSIKELAASLRMSESQIRRRRDKLVKKIKGLL